MSHFRKIREDEDVGVDMAKEDRKDRKDSRSPTADYYGREKAVEDKGPLNLKGGDTLPAGMGRGEQGLLPKRPARVPGRGERFAEGARKVGKGLKRAYEYEPSEETKRTIKKSFRGARDEIEVAGRQYTGGRRYRVRTSSDDVFGLGDLRGYANMFAPEQPRRSGRRGGSTTTIRQGNRTISIREQPLEETLGYDPNDPYGLGGYGGGRSESYGSDFSSYADQFNPFKSFGRRR